MMIEFLRLAEVIRHHSRGEPVYLLGNTGNWGDALIRFGTERFLESFAIPYRRLSLDGSLASRLTLRTASLSRAVLLCMGSGSWCGHFDYLPRTISQIRSRSRHRKIIVLPSTYDRTFDLQDVLFFRRDECDSAVHMPVSIFCHDLAFFIGRIQAPEATQARLNCFRSDVESSGSHVIPAGNRDISAEGTESHEVHPFLEALARYREIHTDRLHVAVGGALLGREVHLYPGRYFKNRAIFSTSFKPNFGNVHWCERFESD